MDGCKGVDCITNKLHFIFHTQVSLLKTRQKKTRQQQIHENGHLSSERRGASMAIKLKQKNKMQEVPSSCDLFHSKIHYIHSHFSIMIFFIHVSIRSFRAHFSMIEIYYVHSEWILRLAISSIQY